MRFRRPSPPPYLNRRDQYRLLVMVGVLCIVIVAVRWAARPQTWHWLVPPADDSRQNTATEDAAERAAAELQARPAPQGPLPEGVFRIAQGEPSDDQQGPLIDPDADWGVDPQALTVIDDSQMGLSRPEVELATRLLNALAELPEAQVHDAAARDATFTVLMVEPEAYRGRLISLVGDVRRLTEYPGNQFEQFERLKEFDTLYEAWFFTPDSRKNPIVVLAPRVDPQLESGLETQPQRVRVTGYFFKRYPYAAESGQHVAPMILAGSIEAAPVATAAERPTASYSGRFIVGLMTAFVLVVVAVVVWTRLLDRPRRRSLPTQIDAGAISALDEAASATDLDVDEGSR